ncbi:MAG: hypothetical protein LQ346_008534 [Caloplaca aetnensis]|nr:MAG: hypothetical protein LQ346_008534 [Caloplaca aetnensis]
MSTTLFDPMLLRDMKFVVYWKDSCLAGYHEVNFIAPSLKIRVVHMVKKDDPRCADMKSLAQAIANETQRTLFTRAAADIWIARVVNARTGRDDGAWWKAIVTSTRRARTEREARAVLEHHGDIGRINPATKERLASLANEDTIDLLYLESLAGLKDDRGNRPSITSLRAQRRRETHQALLLGESERSQLKLVEQLDARIVEREENIADEAVTSRHDDTVAETPQYSNSSTETIGKPAKIQEHASNAGAMSVTMTRGVKETIAEDDAMAVAGAIPEVLTARPADPSAISVGENLSGGGPSSFSSEGSCLTEELPIIMTPTASPSLQSMDNVHEETVNNRQLNPNLQRPKASYQHTLPHSQQCTLPDTATDDPPPHTITQTENLLNKAIVNTTTKPTHGTRTSSQSIDLGSSQGIASVEMSSAPPQGSSSSNQPSNTRSSQATARVSARAASSPGTRVSSQGVNTAQRQHTANVDMASATLPTSSQNTNTTQQAVTTSTTQPNPTAFPRGWNNIMWAYRTHTPADLELQALGIWLFDRPATFQTHPVPDPAIQQHTRIVIAPLSQERNTPSFTSDGQTLVLRPHSTPWRNDPRSARHTDAVTPNFIPETRLAEYQAVEALGYQVWRHDRDYLQCANLACQKILSDLRKDTLLCLGCGPHTSIRYCSRACQVLDCYRHGQDCGMYLHLIPTIVDDGTAPPRFSHLFPALRNRYGIRTYETYRQRTYAQMTGGRYTLFNPATDEPTTIVWDWLFKGPDEYPYQGYGAEMETRIERCLNIALFDQYQTMVVEYLFRLLQQALRIKRAPQAITRVLVDQFAREFGFIAQASWRITSGQSICECEWAGDGVLAHQHTRTCKSRYRAEGELFRGGKRCLKDLVETMEAKYWILRAWRTQHPIEQDWQRRVMGSGFPGCVVPAGWTPRFGKGWVGHWADDDDVCG